MMTLREARQRCSGHNARLHKCPDTGDYEVTLNEWNYEEREASTYFTDDLEDAVLTAGKLRRTYYENATRDG